MRTTPNHRLAGMVIASALAWAGCVSSHVTEPRGDAHVDVEDGHVGVDAHVVSPDAHVDIDAAVALACLAAGEMGCASTERTCCEGTYCQTGGYVVEYDTCLVFAADGEACNYPTECASGVCESGICRNTECLNESDECFAAAQCCAGFCPAEFTYGPSVCTAPLPAGEWCYSDAWCASGACREGSCL